MNRSTIRSDLLQKIFKFPNEFPFCFPDNNTYLALAVAVSTELLSFLLSSLRLYFYILILSMLFPQIRNQIKSEITILFNARVFSVFFCHFILRWELFGLIRLYSAINVLQRFSKVGRRFEIEVHSITRY